MVSIEMLFNLSQQQNMCQMRTKEAVKMCHQNTIKTIYYDAIEDHKMLLC